MRYFYDEIANFAKKDNIDFFAIVKTPWHTFGLYSALKSISEQENKKLFGYIIIENSNDNAKDLELEQYINAIDFVDFKILYSKGEKWQSGKIQSLKQFLSVKDEFFSSNKKTGKNIYCISPFNPAYWLSTEISKEFNNPKINYYVIDEGLGIYIRNQLSWANEYFYSTHNILKTIKYIIILKIDKIINSRLKKKGLYADFSLIQNKHSNKKIALLYKQAFKLFGGNISEDYSNYSSSAIIIGQLYHETGQMKNDCDLVLYKQIVEELKKSGINVIFKPHPRDKNLSRYDCLGCQIEQHCIAPLELIFSTLDVLPKAIIGLTSTSLVSAKMFNDISSFSVNNIIGSTNIKPSLKKEFKAFNKTFKDIVNISTDINEINQFLQK